MRCLCAAWAEGALCRQHGRGGLHAGLLPLPRGRALSWPLPEAADGVRPLEHRPRVLCSQCKALRNLQMQR